MTTAKRNRALAALESLSHPAASKELIPLTGLNEQTVYRYMRRLIDEKKVHVFEERLSPRGGAPERVYAVGPAPEGHTVTMKTATAEALAARKEVRRLKALAYSREFKRKRRAGEIPDTASREAWIDPGFKYTPTGLSKHFQTLTQVWNPAIKGENHATSA